MERHKISEGLDVPEQTLEEQRKNIWLVGGKTPIECRRFFKFLCPKIW